MKQFYFFLLSVVITFSSCQKGISDFDPTTVPAGNGGTKPGSGSFEAVIDGKKVNFSVTSATLLHSTATNQKRMDITGTSTDQTKRLTITLGEETAQGNAMSVKDYVLNAFPDDDPATPNVDESLSTEGFTAYATALGANWLYNVYDEKGVFTVTNCDATSKLVSGNFQTTLHDLIDTTHVVEISAGKITNVNYTVVN